MKPETEQPSLISEEKSMELAQAIELMKPFIHMIDTDYLAEATRALFAQASRMDSMAPMIRTYNPGKSDLIRKQARAMDLLGQYIDELKQISRMKAKLQDDEADRQAFDDMFKI